jgi:hypothetical protein
MANDNGSIDWHYWRNMQEVKIWQACILSLNIDPDSMEFDRDGWMDATAEAPHIRRESFYSPQDCEQYRKRVNLLRSNISKPEHFSPGAINMGNPNLSGVRLAEFAAWAVHIGLSIPSELELLSRSPTPEKPTNQSRNEKPLSTTERNTLLVLIAALCTKASIDSKSRTAASEIARLTDDLGARVSDDTVRNILKQLPDALGARIK